MKPVQKLGVLIVDDHSMTRSGIRALIEGEPGLWVVAEAATGGEAAKLFRDHRPGITLMDLLMPGMNGLDACSLIRSEFPEARIILMSMSPGPKDVKHAVEIGAKGFLDKTFLRHTLIASLQAVAAGGTAFRQ